MVSNAVACSLPGGTSRHLRDLALPCALVDDPFATVAELDGTGRRRLRWAAELGDPDHPLGCSYPSTSATRVGSPGGRAAIYLPAEPAKTLTELETDRTLYMTDRELKEAWQRGKVVRTAREYLDSAGAANFVFYVNEMDPTERSLVEAYPDLAALLDVGDDPLSAKSQSAKYGMTVDEIDWSMIQAVNEKAIKDTPNNGEVAFWQMLSGEVLIGKDQQPETYRKLIELVRGGGGVPTGARPNGVMKVTKGGAFSKGTLAVTGATDQDRMRALIKEFSDKVVTFS